jgi:hypothetical protein
MVGGARGARGVRARVGAGGVRALMCVFRLCMRSACMQTGARSFCNNSRSACCCVQEGCCCGCCCCCYLRCSIISIFTFALQLRQHLARSQTGKELWVNTLLSAATAAIGAEATPLSGEAAQVVGTWRLHAGFRIICGHLEVDGGWRQCVFVGIRRKFGKC